MRRLSKCSLNNLLAYRNVSDRRPLVPGLEIWDLHMNGVGM
jgi:hypothetical protein